MKVNFGFFSLKERLFCHKVPHRSPYLIPPSYTSKALNRAQAFSHGTPLSWYFSYSDRTCSCDVQFRWRKFNDFTLRLLTYNFKLWKELYVCGIW